MNIVKSVFPLASVCKSTCGRFSTSTRFSKNGALFRNSSFTRSFSNSKDDLHKEDTVDDYIALSSTRSQQVGNLEMPGTHLSRRVRISRDPISSTQSAYGNAGLYSIEWVENAHESKYHLMGWSGGDDVTLSMDLRFTTEKEAIAYCVDNGFPYEIEDTGAIFSGLQPKSYADRFKYKAPKSKKF